MCSSDLTVVGSRVLSEMLASQGYEVSVDVERMPTDIDGTSLAPIGLGAIRSLWLHLRRSA